MGLRRPLPQPSTPRRRPATLVALLQRAPTAQLARRPTPDQPRLQPPWAGQLGAACRAGSGRAGAAGPSVGAANRERSEVLAHDGLALAARDALVASETGRLLAAGNVTPFSAAASAAAAIAVAALGHRASFHRWVSMQRLPDRLMDVDEDAGRDPSALLRPRRPA